MMARGGMRRINLIEQEDSQSENSNEIDEDNMVLHVGGGEGNQPFLLKGKINKEPFNTEIDSVSPNETCRNSAMVGYLRECARNQKVSTAEEETK